MSFSFINICPSSASQNPISKLDTVLFPQPLAPTKAFKLFFLKVKLIFLSSKPSFPYAKFTSLNSMFPNSKPCSVFLFGSGTVKTFPIAFRASLNTIEKCCNVAVLLIDAVKADDKIMASIKLGVVIFP